MKKRYLQDQKGFTLVEMMVSTAVAAISMAGVISIFANSVRSNTDNLEIIRLNQEMRAVMDVMVSDIRRAGYWSGADGVSANPFTAAGEAMAVNVGGDCLTYSYDFDGINNAIGNADRQGFRLVNGAVSIRNNSVTCGNPAAVGVNAWEPITDSRAVNISNLNFVLSQASCLNITNSSRACNNAGDQTAIMNVLTISITGQLVGDAGINDQISETVAVRNTVIN